MPTRLLLLPYLQSWDGAALHVRLLLLPRGSPLDPLTARAPSFAEAKFALEMRLVAGLDALPTPGAPATAVINEPVVATAKPVFNALAAKFQIDPAPPQPEPRAPGRQIKKHLPLTYQVAAQFVQGRTPFVFTDDQYSCTIRTPPPRPFNKFPPPNPRIPWGNVIAALLRQPKLGEAAGLIRPLDIAVMPATFFADGGWLYVTLAPASDGAGLLAVPDGLKIYAARVPALNKTARTIFTPVLFPVTAGPPTGSYDAIFAEVDDYDDGFAKTVHGTQPQQLDPLDEKPDGTRPVKELGVRLGWDDEQVTIWFNRQIDPAAATLDAQLGVFGYRIDARTVGDPKWHSLCRAKGPVKVDKVDLGIFDGELGVETHPAQLDGQKTGDYWLPMYFTSWTGPGLATLDTVTMVLSGDRDRADPTRVQALPPEVALRYGKDYEFRVRLMDHTGGGPPPDAKATIPGPAPVATIPFRRWIRPMRLRLQNPPPPDTDPAQPPVSLTVRRPLLGHPAVVLTGAYADPITALRADIATAQAEGREVGLPDPDVVSVQIVVQAQGLAQDPLDVDSGYLTLYQTTRSFPNDPALPLSIDLAWIDVHDALAMAAPAAGPLPLPTARNVRLLIYPLGREDPQLKYFGADDVRLGPPITVKLRKHSSDERNLFAGDLPTHRFSALFLQPDPVVDATVLFAQRAAGSGGQRPSDVPSRLAAQLDLRNDGLTFRARSGRRVVFGCAPSLRHVIGPDNASITFASQSDLVKHWLVVVRLTLDRDWTWDGLAHDGLVVERDGQVVGRFGPTRNVGTDALVAPERSQTDLVFFDAVDPKPAPGAFPSELKILYNIRAELVGAPQKDNPLPLGIRLPVTTPPAQRPQLVSAGIAMSPYVRSADYSSTEPRRRALWLEFDRPPDDPHDRYFARVLRNAPDPLLSSSLETVPETAEAPLAVDPEWIRVVAQDQADDRSGLGAMQELTPSDSPVHFAAPLPAGLTEDSSELFGFFTYELRVGHKTEWTTAQGRYGPPLRVTGVQHPAPALSCAVVRSSLGIIVSAPFAVPVFDGRSVQADKPRSQIWVLLYAQAERVDGQERCNVLLGRKPAPWTGFSGGGRTNEFGTATFGDAEIQLALEALALANEAPLSVLAVELLPNGTPVVDPLGIDLGAQRILRTSPLIPVPAIC